MEHCIFCKIVEEQLENDITVYEDDYVIALVSLHQKSENFGHVLLLPKVHIRDIYELPVALDIPIMSALRTIARAAKKAFSADGIHIRQNNEAAADQEIFHLHFHIIPRFKEDNFENGVYEKLPLNIRKKLAIQLKKMISEEVNF